MLKDNDTKYNRNLEYLLINSKKYFIKKFLGYLFVFLSILIGGIIFARGTNGNFLSLFVTLPFWMELIIYVVVLLFFISGIVLQFNVENNKGKIQFSSDSIKLGQKEVNLLITPVTILLNSAKEKPVYYRSMKDRGGNNWVIFKDKGNTLKFEFLIPSQKEEEELIHQIEAYLSKGFDVKTGHS